MLFMALVSLRLALLILLHGPVYVPPPIPGSRLLFPHSLHGLAAQVAGFAFLSFGAMWIAALTRHPWLQSHFPRWVRMLPWWLFGLCCILYILASYMPQT
jgi:hypothetical protein